MPVSTANSSVTKVTTKSFAAKTLSMLAAENTLVLISWEYAVGPYCMNKYIVN